ncbi:MAG: hypothetical protein HY645_10930 [Acidobacteria bacterium]|nr:hypothetical protein [Acidobacteriota bacterium]
MFPKSLFAISMLGALLISSCGGGPYADPAWLKDRYGVTNAFTDTVSTPAGSVDATIVPVTLADGRKAQMVIPRDRMEHNLYLRDQAGVYPVRLEQRSVDREEFVRSRPVVVERSVESEPSKKRSLKKEVLIVAGSAGAGAAVGGLAGGGKGAAIGALSGGIAGLVYDLATRK